MNQIPPSVNEKILTSVHTKLHPKVSYLLGKVFLAHILSSIITLSVCPQFGFKIFKLPINLMHTFMVFGLPVCNFLCGLFFTTTSMLIASIVLNRDEVRALRHKEVLAASVLILSSIGFFGIMNPNLFIEFSLLWLLGAVLGVILTVEISSRVLARA
ncbi:hypothetical protein DOM21_15270 [Bacteriovorax stolpii]|uniref:Uncharacterized protein n=1 Tax=Bacteriovorax stolpii TaxID=960 RepID=A0A2K9NP52_BACTC|nr:hypothetical protein [Bacteriovorax stolpii]AUN97277.1 hypothetical protein C0V70_03955 [Bacteriovorax stolpii]QDK42785.1 hypothetical protein DOM21_15270 [Bacteriovorax stolpii]TDP52447.1 hypothetical protein C8D79_2211 [Bacteriovorax stolpii]